MTNRPYDAVLFDLDGTLRSNQPDGVEAFIEYASRVGLALSETQVQICEREAHRYWASSRVDADLARYDQRGFWVNYNQLLLNAMNVGDACVNCAAQIQDLFDEYDPVDMVYADTREVLGTLREHGYTVGLVSNRSEDLLPLVQKYGIADYFHFTLSAGQAGCYKPEPGIFYKALALAKTSPERAVYVGDNYFADVIGALNVNVDAILIDPRGIFARYYARRVKHLKDVLGEVIATESSSGT